MMFKLEGQTFCLKIFLKVQANVPVILCLGTKQLIIQNISFIIWFKTERNLKNEINFINKKLLIIGILLFINIEN
jgi:hypothetical protein